MIQATTEEGSADIQTKGFYREVGMRIRVAREHIGESQEKIASSVGLSRTSLTNIEKGNQKFLLHTFIGIAAALGVPITDLLPPTGSSLLDSSLLPKNMEQVERDFVERALSPIMQNESKPPNTNSSERKKLTRTKSRRSTARKR